MNDQDYERQQSSLDQSDRCIICRKNYAYPKLICHNCEVDHLQLESTMLEGVKKIIDTEMGEPSATISGNKVIYTTGLGGGGEYELVSGVLIGRIDGEEVSRHTDLESVQAEWDVGK